MGGDMQPQGHVQIIVNMIDFGLNVQEAGDAARWHHEGSEDRPRDAAERRRQARARDRHPAETRATN